MPDNSLSLGGCVIIRLRQCDKAVIPGEPKDCGRDPWFDRLTTLSEVEGESRKVAQNQIILDPAPDLIRGPRDLARITHCDTAFKGERNLGLSDSL